MRAWIVYRCSRFSVWLESDGWKYHQPGWPRVGRRLTASPAKEKDLTPIDIQEGEVKRKIFSQVKKKKAGGQEKEKSPF